MKPAASFGLIIGGTVALAGGIAGTIVLLSGLDKPLPQPAQSSPLHFAIGSDCKIGQYMIWHAEDRTITCAAAPDNPPEFIANCYLGELLGSCNARQSEQITQIQQLLKDHGIVPGKGSPR